MSSLILPPYLDDDAINFGGRRGHAFCDHFITDSTILDGWVKAGNLAIISSASGITDDQHPGTVILTTGTSSSGYTSIAKGSSGLVGGSNIEIVCESLINIPTLSTTTEDYKIRLGWGNDVAGADHAHGMYFEASGGNSPTWNCKAAGASSRSSSASGLSITTGWTRLVIVHTKVAGTLTAVFYINGVQVQTITGANLPSTYAEAFCPSLGIYKSAGTANRFFYVDYYKHRMSIVTPA